MGGMLDFISGAANEGADIVGGRIKTAQQNDARIDFEQHMTPILQERAKAAQELALQGKTAEADVAEQRRAEQVGKFQKREKELRDQGAVEDVKKAYGDQTLTDADLLPEEKQAFLSDKTKKDAQTRAGMETGMIGLKDVMANDSREEKLAMAEKAVADRLAFAREKLTQDSNDRNARLTAMAIRGMSSGMDKVQSHQFVAGLQKDIEGIRDDVKLKLKALADPMIDEADKAQLNSDIAELNAKRARYERARLDFAKDAGIKVPASLMEEPAAQAKEKDKFESGRTYKDANGNRAKYLGGGKWQPVK